MSGISSVVGLGVAGKQQGGLMTVQGDPAGTPIPVAVSGGVGTTTVQGTAANGAAPVGNPVWVAGYDGALIRAMLLDTSGRSIVVGPTPVASAVVTNPLTVGGVDSGSLVRLLRLDQFNADGATLNSNYAQTVNTVPSAYNGSTADRLRNNIVATLLASAARTATTDSADQTNYNGRGVQVVLSVTAASGTGGLLVLLQGKDPVSGNYYQMNTTPTAVTALATLGYELYPGSSGTAVAAGLVQRIAGSLPRTWRVRVQHGDASSYTYSVAAVVVV